MADLWLAFLYPQGLANRDEAEGSLFKSAILVKVGTAVSSFLHCLLHILLGFQVSFYITYFSRGCLKPG